MFFGDDGPDCMHLVNGPVECTSIILPTVAAPVAEAEYGALFINGTLGKAARNICKAIGYPQGATPLICDNQCATGISNNTVKQRRSKAIDMRYHWIRDGVGMNHLQVVWYPGRRNLTDFFTKAHPVHHHLNMRKYYVDDSPTPWPREQLPISQTTTNQSKS